MDTAEVAVAGQIARSLVLDLADLPPAGDSAAVRHRQETLGGKGANIAVALSRLGAAVSLIGVVGDDCVAGAALDRAHADGIDTTAVVRRPGHGTGLIVELRTDGGHRRQIEHLSDGLLLTEADILAATPVLTSASSVILHARQPVGAVLAAARTAKAARRRVVLEGIPGEQSSTTELLALTDVLRLDQHDGELLTGRRLDSAEAAALAGRDLLRRGPGLVALAAGEDGNVFLWEDEHVILPLAIRDPVHTTGGEDALVAALTFALTRGADPRKAAALAVAASATTVFHPGGRPSVSPVALGAHLVELSIPAQPSPPHHAEADYTGSH
ncbi:PfkB family carbohydrate kinase [Amycolatopsis magusensis]|uniref:PfkB family carbohydrate kinase n=1 Tax=Amycolatopsis magusensis TaxID=882444 RepID=UPI0024A9B4A4|nr:PfkB family carbohydrate kinase [Amycolatopsis magusensis]MDI5975715.1 PfkB family carbohydrate kinase [Amycolatopsis magusensis]